jgi:hypothetical protein
VHRAGWRGTTGVAAALAAALLTAGCGSGGGAHATGGTHATGTRAGTPAAKPAPVAVATTHARPLTQADVWNAVVARKELPGFTVGYVQVKGMPIPTVDPSRLPPVTPAGCAPVFRMNEAASAYLIRARVDAMVGPAVPDTPGMSGMASLTAYSDSDAPRVMADLHNALAACAGLHMVRHDALASGVSYTDARVQPGPRLGDDSVSFRFTQINAKDGENPANGSISMPMTLTVVRVGATVVVFSAEGRGGSTAPAVIPAALVTAQVAKLTRLTHEGAAS